jgi:hypothetical protein
VAQRFVQVFARGIKGPVSGPRGGLVVFDVFGADGGPYKDEVVVKMRAVQDLGGDRVEEGFGQLGLVVVDQQPDVVQLDLVPHIHGLRARAEFLFEPSHALLDAQVIKLDALALRPLLAVPVGGFKTVLGPRRLGAKQPVMAVETVHHGLGNAVGLGGVEPLRKHAPTCAITADGPPRPLRWRPCRATPGPRCCPRSCAGC